MKKIIIPDKKDVKDWFDFSKPITSQIFTVMDKMGYDDESIAFARKEIEEKRNLKFAMNLVETMAMIKAGMIILEQFDEEG